MQRGSAKFEPDIVHFVWCSPVFFLPSSKDWTCISCTCLFFAALLYPIPPASSVLFLFCLSVFPSPNVLTRFQLQQSCNKPFSVSLQPSPRTFHFALSVPVTVHLARPPPPQEQYQAADPSTTAHQFVHSDSRNSTAPKHSTSQRSGCRHHRRLTLHPGYLAAASCHNAAPSAVLLPNSTPSLRLPVPWR